MRGYDPATVQVTTPFALKTQARRMPSCERPARHFKGQRSRRAGPRGRPRVSDSRQSLRTAARQTCQICRPSIRCHRQLNTSLGHINSTCQKMRSGVSSRQCLSLMSQLLPWDSICKRIMSPSTMGWLFPQPPLPPLMRRSQGYAQSLSPDPPYDYDRESGSVGLGHSRGYAYRKDLGLTPYLPPKLRPSFPPFPPVPPFQLSGS
ncbi:hypothetical protein SKAU_G00229100 [Synaphobranchus kaupii]|uniref:Uncharacterized protein n=1 Tax=Synaphobranchus kaupii TaxID=118154 RepID=A0A9Q1F5P1_SYNKA|nr:hypothetical protein SKAU_G00229100 [Synaphobranchus kaupii]